MKTARDIVAEIALGESRRKIHETEGANRGPGIAKYWECTSYGPAGYKDRAPYCAAFVCWVFEQARKAGVKFRVKGPRDASVSAMRDWALRCQAEGDVAVIRMDSGREVAPGDIACFLPNFSHVGIITRRLDAMHVATVEANTSPDDHGSQRDGGGVYARVRPAKLIGSFFRLKVEGEA